MVKKIRPVKVNIHPELYNIMEQERKKYQKKGVHVSQVDLSKALACRLKKRMGVLSYVKKKTKK